MQAKHLTMKPTSSRTRNQTIKALLWAMLIIVAPTLLAVQSLGLYHWDPSIPFVYHGQDDIWQLALTKALTETGWILTNPYLGAPAVANWHSNPAAQTSALHSVLMLGMSKFIHNPISVQQFYYLLNFPLICATSFFACRLLRVSRLPAFCVGMLFAFIPFRMNYLFYAFLANFFMVPLAVVPVMWVTMGHFSSLIPQTNGRARVRLFAQRLLRSRDFLLGLAFVALMGVFDGYYAFFTLLLLGFAGFLRIVNGDWKNPVKLLPVVVYGVVLITTALALTIPLRSYQNAHPQEFAPNGIPDPTLLKRPFEAEVYSASLKRLIAPIPNHRIAKMSRLGQYMLKTSDAARQFVTGPTMVPLGTLGSILFLGSLVFLVVPAVRRKLSCQSMQESDSVSPIDAILALSFFIFLSSINGGIGTLVALVFPTIRAYERFPVFLLFVLFLGAALVVTTKFRSLTGPRRAALVGALILVTCCGLYDQIPADAGSIPPSNKTQFLADRDFVHRIEAELPVNSMVYQYPYSQYQRDSKYYGWGSFAPIRLYLHSHSLRWSNGGAKNSPADDWNLRISSLPLPDLLREVEAAGFKGFVVDGSVLSTEQDAAVRKALSDAGYDVYQDPRSKLALVRLRDRGYRIVYQADYHDLDRVVVTNAKQMLAQNDFPALVNGDELKKIVSASATQNGIVVTRAAHPEAFFDSARISRGTGEFAITPISAMKGSLSCKSNATILGPTSRIDLILHNQTDFDWHLASGQFPIRIGVHLVDDDGKVVSFDEGFRIGDNVVVKQGQEVELSVPFDSLPAIFRGAQGQHKFAQFSLLQEAVTWFPAIECKLPL
jgi:hypothetical protein